MKFGPQCVAICYCTLLSKVLSQETEVSTRGKVVLVTGASSGIGKATAKKFAASGLRVVATGRRKAHLDILVGDIESSGGKAIAVQQDVTLEKDHIHVMSLAKQAFGGVDFVLANAGMEGSNKKLEDQDVAAFKQVFDVNVLGIWLSLKHAVPIFRTHGGGAFVSVSSIGGTLKGFSLEGSDSLGFIIPYWASKAAQDALGRYAGSLYRRENIRVYSLKPAAYRSEMADRICANLNIDVKDLANFNPYFKGIPGNPDYIADMAIAMFDNTTRWKPGQNVVCDGDATISAHVYYKMLEDETKDGLPTNEEVQFYMRDVKGNPYHFSKQSTEL